MDPLNALAPGLDAVRSIWRSGCSWFNSIRKLEDNTNSLIQKNRQLIAKETDIRKELNRAAEQGKQPSNHVIILLEDVGKAKDEVTALVSSVEENNKCFFDWRSRRKLSMQILTVAQQVDRLVGETNQFANELAVHQSPPRALSLLTPLLVGKSTVEKNLAAILGSLRDPMIGKIGVYGMGGSGKTTTIMNVNNLLAKSNEFDKIIWVTVSKDYSFEKVQKEIAQQLSLDLSLCTDEVRRASQLSEKLKHAQKFLIILDDMWVRIPLEKMGIPEPNKENKCKIVLTTRSQVVCHGMETEKNIKLELLSEGEAWELFVSRAGNQVFNLELQPFAKQVARECAGLPLAINTVGRALRQEDNIRVWRKALEDLRSSPTEITGMEEEVFKLLRFSYSRLKNDTLRICFLYMALFPEDYKISHNELIKYWMAENFIKEKGDLETKIDEGFKILKELVEVCMLESDYASIRMHDCIRDLAIHIMKEEGGVLVKAGLGLTESPDEEEWEMVRRVSLMENEIEVLCGQPNCPYLSTLLLRGNFELQNISSSFFNQMPSLQMLDLSDTSITQLPTSLSNLVNLRGLFLQGCYDLKEIPSLVKLQKLGVLNLSSTAIGELPEGMEGLVSLKSLDLSLTHYLEFCAIPRLTLLEELRFNKSQFFEMDSSRIAKCMEEMRYLNRLRILTLSFRRLDDYHNATIWIRRLKMLKNFSVEISNGEYLDDVEPERNSVIINTEEMYMHESTLFFPPNTHELTVMKYDIPQLSSFSCVRNLKFLKRLNIRYCNLKTGDCLIFGEEMEEDAFRSIEYLELTDIMQLKGLWKGVAPRPYLTNLRVLRVHNCRDLRNLFFTNLLQHLQNIEDIAVIGCGLLKEIVVASDGQGHEDNSANSTTTTTTTKIVLPRLHMLEFSDLEKLQSISREMWVCASLHRIRVMYCPELKKLPFIIETSPNLKTGESSWWEALEWDDTKTKNLLQPRFQASA